MKLFRFFFIVILINCLFFSANLNTVLAATDGVLNPESFGRDGFLDYNCPTCSLQYSNGAINQTYEFILPEGRNGMTPKVEINYSQFNTDKGALAGYGWDFHTGMQIRRDSREGIDKAYTINSFFFDNNGNVSEIIPVNIDGNGYGEYRAKYDQAFWKYERSSSGWKVTDTVGNIYTFQTKKVDPNNTSRIYAWYVDKIEDKNTNYIRYTYFTDESQIYPDTIRYTNHEVDNGKYFVNFDYKLRTRAPVSYIYGFKVKTRYILDKVKIGVYDENNNNPQKEYRLSYSYPVSSKLTYLASVQEFGWNGLVWESLPATTFTYGGTGNGFTTYTRPSYSQWQVGLSTSNISKGVQVPAYINDDGLIDYVYASMYGRSVMINNGKNGWNGAGVVDGYGNVITTDWSVPFPTLDRYQSYTNKRMDYLIGDINDDGFNDFITIDKQDNNKQYLYLHNGNNGWVETNQSVYSLPNMFHYRSDTMASDLNTDGRTDFYYNYYEKGLFLHNQSNGWDADYNFTGWKTLGSDSYLWQNGLITPTDINGDGLTDYIYVKGTNNGDSYTKVLYLNNGVNGWDGIGIMSGGNIVNTDWEISMKNFDRYNGGSQKEQHIVQVDVNNDGFDDFIVFNIQTYHTELHLHNGVNGWEEVSSSGWNLNMFALSDSLYDSLYIFDINNDGRQDVFKDDHGVRLFVNNATEYPFLKSVNNGKGAITEFTYKNAQKYEDSSGNLKNTKIRGYMMVVDTITYKNNGTIQEMKTFDYDRGMHVKENYGFREFVGFKTIEQKNIQGVTTKETFYQGLGTSDDYRAKRGLIKSKEILNSSNQRMSFIAYNYTITDIGNERYQIKLDSSIEATYDGDSDNKAKARAYEYDIYGNVIRKIDYGEVNLTSDNGTFTDIGTDKIDTTISYALNTTENIVSLPSQQTSKDNSNNIIADKKFYYDNLSLGQVSAGNQTKLETLVESPSRWIIETRSYNSYGLPLQVTDARNNSTSFIYDSENLFVASMTNALNQTSYTTYNYLTGKIATTTDPNGVKTETLYDAFGRISEVKQSTESDLNTLIKIKDYSYNTSSIPNSVRENTYVQGKTVAKIDYIDGFGKLIQTKQQTGTSQYVVSTQEYDAQGNVKKKYLPKFTSSSAYENGSGAYESMTYDALNRVTQIQNSVLGTSTITYDQWEKSVTDYEGNKKDFVFDARENLVAVKEYLNSTAYTTSYNYNALNNLIKITDAEGNTKEMTYDLRRKKLSETPFHNSSISPSSKTFSYDDNGNLTSKTDLKNQTLSYSYDALNRPTSESGSATLSYTYDSGFIGKIDGIVDPDISKHFIYDNLGRIATEQITVDGTQYNTSFSYDILGNVLTMTYPDSTSITYTYDNGLRQSSLVKGADTLISSASYNPLGVFDDIHYGNGASTENTFDSLYRITNRALKNGTSTLQNIDYTYDKVGNIKTLNETYNSILKNRSYSYDDLYRLTQANETIDATPKTYSYSYSVIGNMLTNSESSGAYSYSGTHPHAVSAVGAVSYNYDANGNMISDGTWTSTWNDRGEMTQSTDGTTIVDYTYDEGNTRVKKTSSDGVTTKVTLYVNQYYEKEGTQEKRFFYFGDKKVAILDDTNLIFTHTDHLDSTSIDTDSTGVIVDYLNYEPYGSVHENEGTYENDYKFTGKELDEDTNLYYYEARYYNSNIGRFISIDPWSGDLTDPQSFNKYSYTRNNPIKYIDPTGESYLEFQRILNQIFFTSQGQEEARAIQNFPQNSMEFAKAAAYSAADETMLGVLPDKENSDGIVKMGVATGVVIGSIFGGGKNKVGKKVFSKFKINSRQNLHNPTHKDFIPGKSEFTYKDPQKLLDKFTGKGVQHGNKEVVDFKETIGRFVDRNTGNKLETTRGTIHYNSKGGAHIVPARPKE